MAMVNPSALMAAHRKRGRQEPLLRFAGLSWERHSHSEMSLPSLLGVRHLPDIAGVCSPIFAE
jgi:hypothetical protein